MAKDLHELLMENDDIRSYFISLPVRVQLTAHHENDLLNTGEKLRRYVDLMTKRNPDGQ